MVDSVLVNNILMKILYIFLWRLKYLASQREKNPGAMQASKDEF